MFFAKKIKMKPGCYSSNDLTEIAEIYIDGCGNPGYFKKEILHDYLQDHPHTIQVGRYPFPDVIPAVSSRDEKYVRSTPNSTTYDNLLSLPREPSW